MLNLKLQYFSHLMQRTDSLEKDPDAGKDWRQEDKGMTEDEVVGWHHWFKGHEFEQALGVGDREAWHAAVHGVTMSQTWLSDWTGVGKWVNVTSQGIFTAQTAFYLTEVIEIFPGRGHGNPLQDSCLENPMDRGYSPWGRKQSGMTERLTLSFFFSPTCSVFTS